MTKFQIWWDDFTSSAKKRLKQVYKKRIKTKPLYDEQLETPPIPITTIEIDDEDEDNYFDDDLIY